METKYIQSVDANLPPGSLIASFVPVSGSPGLYELKYSPLPSIPQGTFTPTPSNLIGADSVDVLACWYVDYGSVVSYRIGLEVLLSTGFASAKFDIDVPVPSNFTNARQANATSNNGLIGDTIAVLAGSNGANTINIEVIGNEVGLTLKSIVLDIEYLKV